MQFNAGYDYKLIYSEPLGIINNLLSPSYPSVAQLLMLDQALAAFD